MKHLEEAQVEIETIGVDKDLLANSLRDRMEEQELSLRKAAQLAGCSPATLSRLLSGSTSEYTPDTATLSVVLKWLNRPLGDFETKRRPNESSLAEVEMHLHALPNISRDDAEAMMAAVKALYAAKRSKRK
jgi:transcriptional regulator with XRE-family HTH domain